MVVNNSAISLRIGTDWSGVLATGLDFAEYQYNYPVSRILRNWVLGRGNIRLPELARKLN